MKVVKPQCLVFQSSPFQMGDTTVLATALGLGFRLSDPRILVHESEVWSALEKAAVPLHSYAQSPPKRHAEWLLVGHATHRAADQGQSSIEWVASAQLGTSKKTVSCEQQVSQGRREAGAINVALSVDHANAYRGARRQNPSGREEINPPLQLATATGWSADPWAAMGPLDPTWTVRRQFLPRGGQALREMGDRQRGPGALPSMMDLRYFQQGSQDQWITADAWQPDEAFELTGFGPNGEGFLGRLPGITPRQFDQALTAEAPPHERALKLKTVVFLPDQDLCVLWWQGAMPLAHPTEQPQVLFTLAVDTTPPTRPVQEIVSFAHQRIDPADSDTAILSDTRLMPPLSHGVVWELIAETEDHPRFNPPRRSYEATVERLSVFEGQLERARLAQEQADHRYKALSNSVLPPGQSSPSYAKPDWRKLLQGPVQADLLDGVTLRGVDLSGLTLTGWTLKRVSLEMCDLRGTRWQGCHLEGVNFSHCDMRKVSMTDLSIRRAKWEQCELQELSVQGGQWQQVEWSRCQCESLRATNVHWLQMTLDRSVSTAWRLQGVDIENWVLSGCDASRWHVSGSQLNSLSLVDLNMSSLHLHQSKVVDMSAVRTNLEGSLMEGCQLNKSVIALGCVLDFASLEDCVWERCTWTQTNASALTAKHCRFVAFCAAGCNLESSRWQLCDLSNADFNDARLKGGMFEGCSLREASLLGAVLDGSQIEGCNLLRAELMWAVVPPNTRWRGNLDAGSRMEARRIA